MANLFVNNSALRGDEENFNIIVSVGVANGSNHSEINPDNGVAVVPFSVTSSSTISTQLLVVLFNGGITCIHVLHTCTYVRRYIQLVDIEVCNICSRTATCYKCIHLRNLIYCAKIQLIFLFSCV